MDPSLDVGCLQQRAITLSEAFPFGPCVCYSLRENETNKHQFVSVKIYFSIKLQGSSKQVFERYMIQLKHCRIGTAVDVLGHCPSVSLGLKQ
jgi:hypothetical protein